MLDDATIHRALSSLTLDGTEGHRIIDELIQAVVEARGDFVRISSARSDARLRIKVLLKDLVSVEAVLNVLARLQDQNSFSKIMHDDIAAQRKFRREPE